MGIECTDVKIQQAINPAAPARSSTGDGPQIWKRLSVNENYLVIRMT